MHKKIHAVDTESTQSFISIKDLLNANKNILTLTSYFDNNWANWVTQYERYVFDSDKVHKLIHHFSTAIRCSQELHIVLEKLVTIEANFNSLISFLDDNQTLKEHWPGTVFRQDFPQKLSLEKEAALRIYLYYADFFGNAVAGLVGILDFIYELYFSEPTNEIANKVSNEISSLLKDLQQAIDKNREFGIAAAKYAQQP